MKKHRVRRVKAKIKPPDADIIEHPLQGTLIGAHADLGKGRRSTLKVPPHVRPFQRQDLSKFFKKRRMMKRE